MTRYLKINKFLIKKTTTKKYHKPDYILIGIFFFLITFGLISLTSAGSIVGFEVFGSSYHFVFHQFLFGFLPGLALFLIFSKVNYQNWQKFSFPFLISSILLLITVFIPGLGAEYGTAKSWINIGGFSFQPAELVKLTFLIYLATWLGKRGESGVKDLYYGFLPFLFVLGIISALILAQPDTGTLLVIIVMCVTVFFTSGAKIKHVLFLFASGVVALLALLKFSPYRAARFTTFLHPELDPLGIGYHINQALLAIGSGGFFGRGFGHSRQKFNYLPEVTGDSIFAVISEELGFIFAALIITLFIYLMYRTIKIIKKTPDLFGKLLATGIITWFVFQAFFNIASMVGLSPMTGIPLPFISYGGSALVVNMMAMGILVNISKQTSK